MEDSASPEWAGKTVRDIYGRNLGRAVGVIFDVGGKIESVGVDAGDSLITVNPEQITTSEDDLVVIPQWKLESRHVGLERDVLRKRISALSRMVKEKRISRELSDELSANLTETRKSHDVVTLRILARLGDLARADRAIDEFVSLVTLQYYAGEMNDEKFGLTTRQCNSIKAMNDSEILDIKLTLGIDADRGNQDPRLLERVARELALRKAPEESLPQNENPSWTNASAESRSDTGPSETGDPTSENGDGPESRDKESASRAYSPQRPRIRELDHHQKPVFVQVMPDEVGTGVPGDKVRSNPESASMLPAPGPLASQAENLSATFSPSRVSLEDATSESPSTSGDESKPEPVLGSQVSEWVFAKIVDLEALDISPGDYRPLKSLGGK